MNEARTSELNMVNKVAQSSILSEPFTGPDQSLVSKSNNAQILESNNSHADQIIYTRNKKYVEPFWQNNVVNGYLNGKDSVQIAYAFVLHPDSKGSIVICSGRIETLLKYKELVFNLYNEGYSVFIHDHRGQGLSGRSTVNPQKGYVDSFDDYVADLHAFVETVVNPNSVEKPMLLCHSMGGAIGMQYLLTHPNQFSRCVLSAPMFGIKPAMPNWLAKCLVKTHLFLNGIFSQEPWYFLGQSDYNAKPFESNDLTSSQARYNLFRREYDSAEELKLGGVTNHWLNAALDCMSRIRTHAKQLKLPILMLQAENDSIVDNQAQNQVCSLLPNCQSKLIDDAKHELLMERDGIRDNCLRHVFAFLEQKN